MKITKKLVFWFYQFFYAAINVTENWYHRDSKVLFARLKTPDVLRFALYAVPVPEAIITTEVADTGLYPLGNVKIAVLAETLLPGTKAQLYMTIFPYL